MSLWLKLTNWDGDECRINMDCVEKYGLDDSNGANAFLAVRDGMYQVRETVEDIDNALLNDASPLRLKKNNMGWT